MHACTFAGVFSMAPDDNDKWDKGEEDFSDELFEDIPEAPETPEPPKPEITTESAPVLPPLHYDEVPQTPGVPNAPIEMDLPCIRCGYNLRSQMPGNSCPECGTPVDHSMRPDLLAQADPKWLGAVLSGVNATLLSATIAIAAFFTLCCTGVFASSNLASSSGAEMALVTMVALGILTIHGLFGYAAFRLTTPEPGRDEPVQTCALARPTLLAAIGCSLFSFTLYFVPDYEVNAIGPYFLLLAIAILTVGLGLLHRYLHTLALRLPDTNLAKRTSVVFWGLTCSLGTGVLLSFTLIMLDLVSRSGTSGSAVGRLMDIGSLMSCMFCPITLGILIFGIIWLTLIGQFRGALVVTRQMAMSTLGREGTRSSAEPKEPSRERERERF